MSLRRPPSDDASEEKYDAGKATESLELNVTERALSVGDDDGALLLPGVREAAERRLVRKLDYRLLPTVILIYILNYIDVSLIMPSLSSAKSKIARRSFVCSSSGSRARLASYW